MNKYCYVVLFFGDSSYIEGVILTAIGLIKQCTKYPKICLITKDMIKFKDTLLQFYDDVIVVPLISTDLTGDIKINSRILKPNINQKYYMTKLHIFNKNILNYDKVIYVDSDLIPVKNFDELFNLPAPSGWLEKIYNGMHVWGYWIFPNNKIPKKYTDIMQKYSSEINTGLLVVKPDNKIFNNMINILQDITKIESDFWGCLSDEGKLTAGYNRVDQQFITQYFSGSWTYLNEKFNVWGGTSINKIYGIHMAGLRFKINGKDTFGKTWMYQTQHNSAYDKITNETLMWGIKNIKIKGSYKNIFFNKLSIISDHEELYNFYDCPVNLLTPHQKLVKILLESN